MRGRGGGVVIAAVWVVELHELVEALLAVGCFFGEGEDLVRRWAGMAVGWLGPLQAGRVEWWGLGRDCCIASATGRVRSAAWSAVSSAEAAR